ncbi:MAG: tetraacyldisaccharide 4'-kinase, partial [Planctomycetota bacterium]|nr:tetraacyldisaccharide 4'-kinase [Planctomycetota bacterium]
MRTYILNVLAGRKKGVFPFLIKGLLSFASGVYRLLHITRKGLYQAGILRSARISIPVISVGNLTMGGTGKTPIVEMLARKIAQQGLPTAILARGYGKIDPSQDDENLLFDIDHVIRLTGANRVESAK